MLRNSNNNGDGGDGGGGGGNRAPVMASNGHRRGSAGSSNADDDGDDTSSYVYSSSSATDSAVEGQPPLQRVQARLTAQSVPQTVRRVATTTNVPASTTCAPPPNNAMAAKQQQQQQRQQQQQQPAVAAVPMTQQVVAPRQLQVDFVPVSQTVEVQNHTHYQQHQHMQHLHSEEQQEMRVVHGRDDDDDSGTASSSTHHHHHHRNSHRHRHHEAESSHEGSRGAADSAADEKRMGMRTTRFVQRVLVYVFFGFTFVQLLFDILACALSQLDEVGGGCYTYWGYKAVCNTVVYTRRTALLFDCTTLRSYLMAGAAFSILAILGATAVFVLAWVLCCVMRAKTRYERIRAEHANVDVLSFEQYMHNEDHLPPFHFVRLKTAIFVTSVVTLVFELIAWAVIAGAFGRRLCEDRNLLRTTTYGVGFGLGVTAWVLGVLFLVVFVVFI